MPGGGRAKGIGPRHKSRHKKQKKRFMRAKDPIQAVFMWGIQHSINEIRSQPEPSLLLEEDFKAFSKIRVENQYYNKEYLPGHFKFKEYCPRVFNDLRKRFNVDNKDYMLSLAASPPTSMDSPGRSGSAFFLSFDKKLVIKSLSSEEVALLHQLLQQYHAHIVTLEGRTLLPQYLGMYRLTVNNAETYWIVMRNVFSHQLKMHVKFDLKGSTVDRAASDKEKAKQSPTYKDNDFIQMDKKIYIGDEAKATFMSTLEADVKLLQELNLMDYSLLIGIHDCTAPMVDSEDDYTDDEIDNSGDELREDSPTTPVSGEETQPQFEALTDTVTTTTTSPPDETNNVDEVDQVVTKETGGATAVESDVSVVDKGAVVTFAPLPYKPILVAGNDDEIEKYLAEGYYPVINKEVDIFALIGLPDKNKEIYFMAIIDVLTNYGSRKRAAHAAKTMKHGAGAEISTVKPEQYSRRFLEFIDKSIQ